MSTVNVGHKLTHRWDLAVVAVRNIRAGDDAVTTCVSLGGLVRSLDASAAERALLGG